MQKITKNDKQMANKPLSKLKLQWDITVYLLEWLKWQVVTPSNAGGGAEKRDHSHTAA